MPDPIGRVKACTECRQQKVRCDAFKDYSRPCSRCRAAGLPCVISKDFQRRPRQTKAQLQYELDRLKAQSESLSDHPSAQTATDSPQSNGRPGLHHRTSSDQTGHGRVSQSQQRIQSDNEPNSPFHEPLQRSSSEQQNQPQRSPIEPSIRTEGTLGRALGDITLDPGKINDCYALFLSHYAVQTHGLLEMIISPNQRYQQSPLLFWVIVCVGSRGYAKDPTLYGRLGEPVLDLMFKSLIRPPQALPVIQAAIVLCRWPFPVDLVYREPSEALAGAAVSLAMQNGLHMYSREQDFVVRSLHKPKPAYYDLSGVKTIRDEVVRFRTRIWAFCAITFQDVYVCDGLPPLSVVPCFRRSESYGDISELLPERLSYNSQIHRLKIEAINLIAGACDVHGKGYDQTLNAMITTYDDRVRQVPLPQENDDYRFMRSCVSMSVMSLLYVAQQEPDHMHALRLYRVARETAGLAIDLDRETPGSHFYLPHFYHRMSMLATHIMLRLCKSPLGEKLDMEDAKSCIFGMVDVFRQRICFSNDLASYHCIMIPELWTSKKAFVQGGKVQNGLRVNMRYRLILNPVFDSFWWWRKEFGRPLDEEHVKCAETTGFQDPSTSEGCEQREDSTDQPFAMAGVSQPETMSNLDAPMPNGDGFWTSSLDTVFADFMQWWDFNALDTDIVQSAEYSPGEGSSIQDTQMTQPQGTQMMQQHNQMPETLTSGSNRLI